ncbi:unnamed protein product [Agarophyton chilense]
MDAAFLTSVPIKESTLKQNLRRRTSCHVFVRTRAQYPNGDMSPQLNRRELLKGISGAAFGVGIASSNPQPAGSRQFPDSDFVFDAKSGSFVPPSALGRLLRRDQGSQFDRCIVAAEVHDNMRTHAAQLAVIDSARRMADGKQLIVGFEQFYRTHNHLLDRYVRGILSVNSLLQVTDWDRTWGMDPKLYIPIFEYCRIYGIPMVGLNIPRQFVLHVSQLGLDGIPEELKEFLPDKMDFSNREHFEHFKTLMSEGHGEQIRNKAVLDRFYEIQVLWEEWMSQSVAQSLKSNPESRIVALIGSGHVEGRYGFPDRIEKRCSERPYTIVPRPVAWERDDGYSLPQIDEPERNIADLVWYTRRRIDLV